MVRKLNFKDPLLGLGNVKWGRGITPISLRRPLGHGSLHGLATWLLIQLLPSPHLLVLVTSEQLLPARDTFRAILDSESHWLQPVLVLSVRWWPTPTCMGRVYSIMSTSIELLPPF